MLSIAFLCQNLWVLRVIIYLCFPSVVHHLDFNFFKRRGLCSYAIKEKQSFSLWQNYSSIDAK